MKVVVLNKRLASVLDNEKSIRKKFGKDMAKKIQLRLISLTAAQNLGDFWPPYSGPERCHEMKGNLAGYFSLDLKHPNRMLIRPLIEISKEEFPKEKDRWNEINEVVIEEILDTHG